MEKQKNLFILHTQYNIILGASVALAQYSNCQNDLIVYAEFTVSDEYKSRLSSVFNNVYFIREKYQPLPIGLVEAEMRLAREYRVHMHTEAFATRYDHVLMSQENPLDCLILGHSKSKNPSCTCSDIEEDCYYSNSPSLNNPDYKRPQGHNRIHKLRKLLYGKKYIASTETFFYGQSVFYNDYYVLYPDLLRPQLQGKTTHQIEPSALVKSVGMLYNSDSSYIPDAKKYYLFFFDLLERYNDVDSIKAVVKNLYEKAVSEGALFLAKYHPRETDKLHLGDNIFEIPASIPAEKLLCDLVQKDVTVLGNATTAVIVANKLGFKTVCIAKINNTDNPVMLEQMSRMGIHIPSKVEEVL